MRFYERLQVIAATIQISTAVFWAPYSVYCLLHSVHWGRFVAIDVTLSGFFILLGYNMVAGLTILFAEYRLRYLTEKQWTKV